MFSMRSMQATDKPTAERYRRMDVGTSVICTYIWVDDFGKGEDVRGKARVFNFEPEEPEDLPVWAHSRDRNTITPEDPDHERFLKPVALFKDPFRGGPHKLVMCEIMDTQGHPTKHNFRRRCAEIMELVKDQQPWFGMEQEYILFDLDGHPFGWPKCGVKMADANLSCPSYCGVGANKVIARDVSDAHLNACLNAGLKIFGTNAESMEGQWEYQLGPIEGVAAADELWISRYILHRVAEDFGIVVSMACKPIDGYNANGCHMNFSTKAMREDGGIDEIYRAVSRMKDYHFEHLACYAPDNGKDNEKRLMGSRSAPQLEEFTAGVSSRLMSVRIPLQVHVLGKGYLEDRRPAGNCDPYLVITALGITCCLRNGERKLSKTYTPPLPNDAMAK